MLPYGEENTRKNKIPNFANFNIQYSHKRSLRAVTFLERKHFSQIHFCYSSRKLSNGRKTKNIVTQT